MALRGSYQIFRAIVNELHRTSGFPGQQRGVTGDHRRIFFLAAEASTGFRLNDSDLLRRQRKQLQQGFVDVVGALHGAPNRDAIFGIGDCDSTVGFDVELLLSSGGIFAFDDVSRRRPCFIDAAFLDQERFENVVVTPYDLFSRQRFFECEHGRQLLYFDANSTAGLFE